MSVATAITLPVTPAAGSVVYTPLGGDGFSGPKGCYSVRDLQVVGDGSSGSASISVSMDSRYANVIAFATWASDETQSIDKPVTWMVSLNSLESLVHTTDVPIGPGASFNSKVQGVCWSTPPQLLQNVGLDGAPPVLSAFMANDNPGVTYFLSTLLYCYNVEARYVVPPAYFFANRGST